MRPEFVSQIVHQWSGINMITRKEIRVLEEESSRAFLGVNWPSPSDYDPTTNLYN